MFFVFIDNDATSHYLILSFAEIVMNKCTGKRFRSPKKIKCLRDEPACIYEAAVSLIYTHHIFLWRYHSCYACNYLMVFMVSSFTFIAWFLLCYHSYCIYIYHALLLLTSITSYIHSTCDFHGGNMHLIKLFWCW